MAAPAPRPPAPPVPGPPPTVLVMGAGNIGCWLGGRLQAAGARVQLVGRPRMLQALADHGLTLTDREGAQWQLPAASLQLHPSVPAGLEPDLVLLCGMVPFNVAELGPGRLHRGTDGQLAAQAHPGLAPCLAWFEAAGLPLALHDDLLPVQWGKLLLNLNNAVNALSGLPLRQQLLDADHRMCTAGLISETLFLLKAAGIRPARLGPVRPGTLPRVLRLRTPLFRLVARRMLRIDDKARSSMADDLARNRPTEIDAIQGEVLRLASRLNQQAPCNARISQLVRAWSPHSQPLSA